MPVRQIADPSPQDEPRAEAERRRRDLILGAPPRDGAVGGLGVRLAPSPMGEFHLRIETAGFCTWVDNDDTTAPNALHEPREAPGRLAAGEATVIWFDDESLDTARLTLLPDAEGWTRFFLDDWCARDRAPRLDLRIPTRVLAEEIGRALAMV